MSQELEAQAAAEEKQLDPVDHAPPKGKKSRKRSLPKDAGGGSDLFAYCITLTCKDGFTDEQEKIIVEWHVRNSEKCLLVDELHESGEKHYHSLIHCKAPKSAGNVTNKLKNLYSTMNKDITHNSIRVKRQTDFVGWLHYLSKDIPADKKPLLTMGWGWSWIKQQCKDNVRKIPIKILLKDKYTVKQSAAVATVAAWAQAAGYPLVDKQCFMTCIVDMQSEGYQFHSVKFKWLYAESMAMNGNKDAALSLLENELFHLR